MNKSKNPFLNTTVLVVTICFIVIFLGFWTHYRDPRPPKNFIPISALETKRCMEISNLYLRESFVPLVTLKDSVFKVSENEYIRYAYTIYNIPIAYVNIKIPEQEIFEVVGGEFSCNPK